MSRILTLWIFLLILAASTIFAQGPKLVAVGDRHLWRERIDSPTGFDKASRAAILVYAQKLQDRKAAEMKRPALPSILKWLDKELALARSNYWLASKICAPFDWTCIGNIGDAFGPVPLAVPTDMLAWKSGMERFVTDYIAEQTRLAALFPRITSEIDMFNSNEFDGERLPDRRFFLTIDDGPTEANGNTDGVLQMLAANKKTAVFFLLGGNLKNRLRETGAVDLAAAYRGQCVASHGWEHVNHASSSGFSGGRTWQTSVTDTHALLRSTFANGPSVMPLFRPPYGQRRSDSGAFFQQQSLRVALWNLDSQDWNPKLTAEDVTNRIETLMLIKRHGILLFHDIHPKAKTAVPVLINDLSTAIDWGTCGQISDAF